MGENENVAPVNGAGEDIVDMDIPPDLVESIAQGDAVLFVGAGLSMGAKLPSWKQLLAPLVQEASEPIPPGMDLLQVAEFCKIDLGENRVLGHVIQMTDASRRPVTDNHQLLLELGIRTWVTTNYDDLLETTLRQAGVPCNKIVYDTNLAHMQPDAVTLIKLHGDRQDPDTIVLTESDYELISDKKPLILTQLKADFASKTFLFVGYGINDPDLKQIQREIGHRLGGFQRRAYAVLLGRHPVMERLLRDRQIEPLTIEVEDPKQYSEHLGKWLDALVECVGAERLRLKRDRPAYQIRAEERHARETVPQEPPAQHALDLYQIKAPPRKLWGRDQEIEDLERMMSDNPLVLLWGSGGGGKRALARKLAYLIEARYSDAQLHCDLAGTTQSPLSTSEAMREVIQAFHPDWKLPDEEGQLAKSYRATLSRKEVLLLFTDAADKDVVRSLKPPPSCAMIVTSRQDLDLKGDDFEALRVRELRESDAVDYLLELAPRIGDHAARVAELCGYWPLALRQAGTRLDSEPDLPVPRLIKLLETLRLELEPVVASLRVNYDGLQPDLQGRWLALSVFPGSFDRAAAAAVWGLPLVPDDAVEDEVGDTLRRLRRHALISFDNETQRYQLPTLHRRLAEDLLSARERLVFARRHARHYLQVLREANKLYEQGDQGIEQGLEWFKLERNNIETGQAWAASHWAGEARSLCVQYPLAGANVLSLRLEPKEFKSWIERAIQALPKLGNRSAEADLEGNLGNVHRQLGDLNEARARYEKAADIARRDRNRESESYWRGRLGHVYLRKARLLRDAVPPDQAEITRLLEQSVELCEQALEIAIKQGYCRIEGLHRGNLGNAYLRLKKPWDAIDQYKQALTIAQNEGDRRGESTAWVNLGRAYQELKELDKAIEFYEKALIIDDELGDRWSEARHRWALGQIYQSKEDWARAIELMSQCVEYEREIGHQRAEDHAAIVKEIEQHT